MDHLSAEQLRVLTQLLATYSLAFTGLIFVRDLTFPLPAGLVSVVAIGISAGVFHRTRKPAGGANG